MNIISELSDPIELTRFGDSYRFIYQDKLSRGTEMIELGTWVKWSTDQQFHPSKNRMMVEKKVFKDIILPKLNEIFRDK